MNQRNLPIISLLMTVVSIFAPQSHGYELTFPFFRDGYFTNEANKGNLNHDKGMVKINEEIKFILLFFN